MDDKTLRSYRLNSMEEPTDEMLLAIMEKVADAARESTRKAEMRKKEMLSAAFRNAQIIKAQYQQWLKNVLGGHEVPTSKIISRYYKSLTNAALAIKLEDRAYDNSIDDKLPQLLYRTIDGHLKKQYSSNLPEWAMNLIK